MMLTLEKLIKDMICGVARAGFGILFILTLLTLPVEKAMNVLYFLCGVQAPRCSLDWECCVPGTPLSRSATSTEATTRVSSILQLRTFSVALHRGYRRDMPSVGTTALSSSNNNKSLLDSGQPYHPPDLGSLYDERVKSVPEGWQVLLRGHGLE